MTEVKKEFNRLFRFVVKNKEGALNLDNKRIKDILKWAWFYQRLFIVRDGSMIVGVAIAWRTDHPENKYEDLTVDNTELGDYLHIFQTIVHPDYRNRGVLFQLFYLIESRFPNTKRVFWTDRKGKMRIRETGVFRKELYKWASLAVQHQI